MVREFKPSRITTGGKPKDRIAAKGGLTQFSIEDRISAESAQQSGLGFRKAMKSKRNFIKQAFVEKFINKAKSKNAKVFMGFSMAVLGIKEIQAAIKSFNKELGLKKSFEPIRESFISYLKREVRKNIETSFKQQGVLVDDIIAKEQGLRIEKWANLSEKYASRKMNKQMGGGRIGPRKGFTFETGRSRGRGGTIKKARVYARKTHKGRTILTASKILEGYQGKKYLSSSYSRGYKRETMKWNDGDKKVTSNTGRPIGILTGEMYRALIAESAKGAHRRQGMFGYKQTPSSKGSNSPRYQKSVWLFTYGIDVTKVPQYVSFTEGRPGRKGQPARPITFFTDRAQAQWEVTLLNTWSHIIDRLRNKIDDIGSRLIKSKMTMFRKSVFTGKRVESRMIGKPIASLED